MGHMDARGTDGAARAYSGEPRLSDRRLALNRDILTQRLYGWLAVALSGFTLLVPAFCGQKKGEPVMAANAKAMALVGKPAPGFSLADGNGQTFNLADDQIGRASCRERV